MGGMLIGLAAAHFVWGLFGLPPLQLFELLLCAALGFWCGREL